MLKKNLSIIITLAWRNIWKNKRRTILTLLTIMIGCAMILFFNAIAKGYHDQMIEDAVIENTGHIQIHNEGFWERKSTQYVFKADENLINLLNKNDNIKGYTSRINTGCMIISDESSIIALIQAINPVKEKNVTNIHTTLKEGSFLKGNETTEVVIGNILAKNLEVKIGDKIGMVANGFKGSSASEWLTVKGIVKTANPEINRYLILMNLDFAKDHFDFGDWLSSIVIRCKKTEHMENVRDNIRSYVHNWEQENEIEDYDRKEIMGWDELMPFLVQFIVMDDISAYIFDFILFMVVAFGVLNTIQMSVFERTREFGVMLAIGTEPKQLVWTILAETVFITVFGIILGIIIGGSISYYFGVNPMDMSSYADEMEIWGVNTFIMPADMSLLSVAVTSITIFFLSFTFSIFPARRAAKLNPIDAIRQL